MYQCIDFQGNCGEKSSRDFNISREEQDQFALNSYLKTEQAAEGGVFNAELTPVPVKRRPKGVHLNSIIFLFTNVVSRLLNSVISDPETLFEKDEEFVRFSMKNLRKSNCKRETSI